VKATSDGLSLGGTDGVTLGQELNAADGPVDGAVDDNNVNKDHSK
jgi:hypothetical protein